MKKRRWMPILVLATFVAANGFGQDDPSETLVEGGADKSLQFELETKFSSIAGEFANFTGMNIAVGLGEKFQIGVGGYGLTNATLGGSMGYGGIFVGYSHRPHRMMHLSFGGLVAAGNATFGRSYSITVIEPKAELTLNVTRMLRLGVGVDYRFVGGAGNANGDLSGWAGTFNVGLALFRD